MNEEAADAINFLRLPFIEGEIVSDRQEDRIGSAKENVLPELDFGLSPEIHVEQASKGPHVGADSIVQRSNPPNGYQTYISLTIGDGCG